MGVSGVVALVVRAFRLEFANREPDSIGMGRLNDGRLLLHNKWMSLV